jgi:hypothetical protein
MKHGDTEEILHHWKNLRTFYITFANKFENLEKKLIF